MRRTTAILLNILLPTLLACASAGADERGVPSNGRPPAAPRTAAANPSGYRLGPADVIQVFVWKEPDLSTTVTVRPDGRITLPLAGELTAADKTPKQLEEELATRLSEYIDTPLVTVIVKEVESSKVSVLGEVQRPGRFVISQKTTVLDAIAMSGGFTEFAHRGEVLVLRPTSSGVRRIPVHVKRMLKQGGRPFYLQPGDTVHVD